MSIINQFEISTMSVLHKCSFYNPKVDLKYYSEIE